MAISKVILNDETLMDVTADTVEANKLLSGYQATKNDGTKVTGTYTAPTYSSQTKSVSPTESQQTVTPDSGYDGLSQVTVGAVSSSYVGTGVTRRSSSDLSASGATVTAPAGYYASSASKSVASGTAGTPSATKGTVSNHSISVTPSVTNTTGYITGGTKTGTAVSVAASELVSGNKEITENGTNIDVTNYATVSVDVAGSGGDISVGVPVYLTITNPGGKLSSSKPMYVGYGQYSNVSQKNGNGYYINKITAAESRTLVYLPPMANGNGFLVALTNYISQQSDTGIALDTTNSSGVTVFGLSGTRSLILEWEENAEVVLQATNDN